MASPATDLFLTPNAPSLALRAVRDPAIETTARRGDPLLVVGWPGGGFVEVDHAGESWFALQRDLAPWSGAGEAPWSGMAGESAPAEAVSDTLVAPFSERPAAQPWTPAPVTPPPGPGLPPPGRERWRGARPSPPALIAGIGGAVLAAVLLLVAGFWRYPLGWVMCDGFAHIESVERVGGETLVICSGGHALRAPFRKYGAALPSRPGPAGSVWRPYGALPSHEVPNG